MHENLFHKDFAAVIIPRESSHHVKKSQLWSSLTPSFAFPLTNENKEMLSIMLLQIRRNIPFGTKNKQIISLVKAVIRIFYIS